MDIETLLGKSVEELEKMSQRELEGYLSKYLPHTRPKKQEELELMKTQHMVRAVTTPGSRGKSYSQQQKERAEGIAKRFGIEL